VAETIRDKVHPHGVAVVMEATHLCMAMRGVAKQNSVTVTSAMLGVFHTDARTRHEFLELIRRPSEPAALSERSLVDGVGCDAE
jgi:GTP cyclohydrolase I